MLTEDHLIELGKRIKRDRKRLGISQGVLARAAGISRNYLSMIERAKTDPSWRIIQSIAGVLGWNNDSIQEMTVWSFGDGELLSEAMQMGWWIAIGRVAEQNGLGISTDGRLIMESGDGYITFLALVSRAALWEMNNFKPALKSGGVAE